VGGGFALGAKLVFPDHDVWIIYGDGSAAYSLMEYDTFVRHKLPVISVIGNDACWSQIARDQIEILKSDCAMNLAFSDYQDIGKAFGAEGARVESPEAFNAAVSEAKTLSRSGTPYIINAIIGKTDFRKGSVSM
jgi:thiamine pyrophosphate-dependent acetolactate synthase large subunit-like protein